MITRPAYTQTRPILKSSFTEDVSIVRVNPNRRLRDDDGEPIDQPEPAIHTKCSTNPISADDERLAHLQASGVRLTGLREFFTIEVMNVDFKDEFVYKGNNYVAVQTADWGHFQATIASLKEGQ